MRLMRHSDLRLTAQVYTDEMQLPIYDAIKKPNASFLSQVHANGGQMRKNWKANAKFRPVRFTGHR